MADPDDPPSAHQSLYRRFRPQRFEEVVGQDHVALALRNAVRQDRVGHAYLFSGPRGTGKTSTARILAKALNCAKPDDGEPCGVCDSCVDIARGTSLDVHELDAASNNGVDAMRDLVARAALGTPGRWKVYIVDEVHMLSAAASNALLKTLEEPPGHVVFVLATTDPQKVLPTIRSRTQHFEFRLLGPDTLTDLVGKVRDAAGLELGEDAVAAAVRRGRGSARDALSVLDQLAAAGEVDDEVPVLADLGRGLADHDARQVLLSVAQATAAGRAVHALTAALVEYLRQGFLAMVAPELTTVVGGERDQVEDIARRMGLPALVRAMEMLGRAEVDMRDAPDARVTLETALIRLSHPEADDSPAALLERIDRLERQLAAGGPPPGPPASTAPAAPAPAAAPSTPAPAGRAERAPAPPADPAGASSASGPEIARQSLGALRRQARGRPGAAEPAGAAEAPAPAPAPVDDPPAGGAPVPPPPAPAPPGAGPGALPSRDALVQAWGDGLLTTLSNRARARFRVGRFLAVEGGAAVFALPNETHRSYCEEVRHEVERVLAGHFGTPVPMRLVVDEESGEADRRRRSGGPSQAEEAEVPGAADDEAALLDPEVLAAETDPAGSGPSAEERLKQIFPGAQEL